VEQAHSFEKVIEKNGKTKTLQTIYISTGQ